jgi:hypothetical protein
MVDLKFHKITGNGPSHLLKIFFILMARTMSMDMLNSSSVRTMVSACALLVE